MGLNPSQDTKIASFHPGVNGYLVRVESVVIDLAWCDIFDSTGCVLPSKLRLLKELNK